MINRCDSKLEATLFISNFGKFENSLMLTWTSIYSTESPFLGIKKMQAQALKIQVSRIRIACPLLTFLGLQF